MCHHKFVVMDSNRLFCEHCGVGKVFSIYVTHAAPIKIYEVPKNPENNYANNTDIDSDEGPSIQELEAEAIRIASEALDFNNTYTTEERNHVPVNSGSEVDEGTEIF